MTEKPKATKDVESLKLKHIDIPPVAKAEITRLNQPMSNYIAGVVAGLGIEGEWSFDMQKMQFIVKEKQ